MDQFIIILLFSSLVAFMPIRASAFPDAPKCGASFGIPDLPIYPFSFHYGYNLNIPDITVFTGIKGDTLFTIDKFGVPHDGTLHVGYRYVGNKLQYLNLTDPERPQIFDPKFIPKSFPLNDSPRL